MFFFLSPIIRGQRLEESLEYQQFVANVEEEEAWINEKMTLVASEDYGDTLAAIQVRETGTAPLLSLPAGSLGLPGWSQSSRSHARDGAPLAKHGAAGSPGAQGLLPPCTFRWG